jgi:Domain of unknown function (DUF4124)
MKLRILVAAIFFMIPGLTYLGADVYRWSDSQGNTYYGNRPPAEGRNIKLMFKEVPSDPAANQQEPEAGPGATEAIIEELDEELRREAEDRKQKEAAAGAPAARQDLIAGEKEKLEKKIAELEALPLEYFGSQKNKRVRIGYFQYRLETLMNNPQDYFNNPEPFEGNTPPPPKNRKNP